MNTPPNAMDYTQAIEKVAAVPEAGKTLTKYTAEHGREIGLPSPEAINFMVSVANLLTRSALITPDMGNDPEQVKANAIAKMLVGRGLGITDPMQALQDIYIVKGKIFVGYPQLLGIMMRKGFRLSWEERSEKRAALKVTPPPDFPMAEETFEYTIEDARRAGLIRDGSQYAIRPRIMLTARAASEAYRATGGGSVYDPQEREEIAGNNGNHDIQEPEPEPERNPFQVSAAPAQAQPPAIHLVSSAERNPFQGSAVSAKIGPTPPPPTQAVETPEIVQSGASVKQEPPAEPVRRGRKPRTPEGPAAMDALKAAAPPVPEPAKGEFRATDDDLPAEIAPTPQPEPPQPMLALSQVDRLKAIEATLAKQNKRDAEFCNVALRTFVKAFTRLDKLPKPPDALYETHLPIFESYAKLYGGQMLGSAQECGAAAGASWASFVRKIDQWPEDLKALAKMVAIARHPDEAMDLLVYAMDTAGIPGPGTEMYTFLSLLRISNEALKAARKASAERGLSLEQVVSGLNLRTAGEAQVLSHLAGAQVATPSAGAQEEGKLLWE